MGSRSWSAVAASVLVVAACFLWQPPVPGREPAAAKNADGKKETTSSAAHIAGRSSCSGRACHGGFDAAAGGGAQQNEFTTWLAFDKHARAFDVLKGDRARRMAKNLGIESADKDARCLACHSTPQLAGPVSEELAALRSDGVSCEACHGPAKGADGWLEAHTRASWKQQDGKNREDSYHRYGMTPLFDLEVQAKTCAGCHVGAPADPEHGIPARDLNHDLMAAGHPRLTFELGTFRANMPPHWRHDLHTKTPGYEAAVWAVGQAAAAKASVDLSEHRAKEAAAGKAPWPEFAEASCFACHADLQSPSWRRSADYYSNRRPGAIPANRWYSALLPVLDGVAQGKGTAADKAYQALAAELNRAYPDPAKVQTLAGAARKDLDLLLAAVKPANYDAAAVKALAAGLGKQAGTCKDPSWDELTQSALAAAALREAAGAKGTPEEQKALDDVFIGLAFPSPFESPEGYSPRAKGDGQADDLQARVLKALEALKR
jgi:hypothetical protein